MSEEQHKEYLQVMEKAIESNIDKFVNGKIRKIDEKLTIFIADTLEWREVATPVIRAGNSLYAVGKIAVYFFGGLATIAGGIAVIKIALINLISK